MFGTQEKRRVRTEEKEGSCSRTKRRGDGSSLPSLAQSSHFELCLDLQLPARAQEKGIERGLASKIQLQ